MAIEIRCPGCGRTLRIGEEHVGKQVRCPACLQISVAPGTVPTTDSPAVPPAPADTETAQWHMRTPDGQTYGPISWRQVEDWVGQGRISADCQLASSADGPWQPASERFPKLASTASEPTPKPTPTIHNWADSQPLSSAGGAYRFSPGVQAPVGGYMAPHRGGLILVLGLLGIIVGCPLFGLIAWVMGSNDLREMNAGRMDRSGEGLTQVGYVLGMIVSILTLLACGLSLLVAVFAALAANW